MGRLREFDPLAGCGDEGNTPLSRRSDKGNPVHGGEARAAEERAI